MIIGIAGRKQCGKDTICNIIRYLNYLKYNQIFKGLEPSAAHFNNMFSDYGDDLIKFSEWEKHAFADALKACSSLILGVDMCCFETEDFKESPTTLNLGMTNREFLQKLGTEIGRNIHPDLWVLYLMQIYESNPDSKWIITDVRFPNEADAIISHGGIVIKVERDTGLDDQHISEHALDDYEHFSYVIKNNGTIDALIDKVKACLGDYI